MTTGSLGRRLSSLLLSVAAALIGAALTAAPASAHAELLESNPGPGAVLANSPSELTLRFSEKVTLVPNGIRLLDSRGDPVPIGQPNVQDSTVVVPLEDILASDGYVLTWRVVSADSHPINGAVPFAVGDAEPGVAAPASEPSSAKSALVGARWAGFLGLVLFLGPVLFVLLCWRDGQYDVLVSRLITVGAGVIVISSGAAVLLQGAYAAGLPVGQAIDTDLLETTLRATYGQAAAVRIVLVLALLAVLALLRTRPSVPVWVVTSVMAAGVVVTYSLQGHAIASSDRLLRVASDSLHLAAMTCWIGGLVVLASCLLRSPLALTVLSTILPRWSRVAITAVAVLVVTGTYQSVRELGSLSALTGTSYGQTLLVKLGLFAVLIGLAYVGRTWVRSNRTFPTGNDAHEPNPPAAVGRLRRSVMAEAALGAAVLAVTAVLVATTPGHSAGDADVAHHGSTSPAESGFSEAVLPNGDNVEVTVVSDRVVAVRITNHHGHRIQPEEVRATASLSEQGIQRLPLVLSTLSTGIYRAQEPLPFAGSWRITVTVRTSALEAGVATLSVVVR